ncbi:UNVERIFIED_CONTAM: hypothetical protein PYX00_001852 [Menopon gallinae]|uniref:BHLH domain-containing protein n=1 Tax=Menopon gallinae TaxID=328185 RepID=A0AAW2IFQ1_9NEOP
MEILPRTEDEGAAAGPGEGQTGSEADANNNSGAKPEKYSLRPRSRNKKSADKNRPKQKPPPLSKYRRKTANARERNRMREINIAFETLRRAVPHISGNLNSGNEKLTKITTLRLAMKYIQALRQVLDSGHPAEAGHFPGTGCDDPDLDILLSDGESLHFNSDISESLASPDHPLTSPVSEPSENSPLFPEGNFSFHDSLIVSDFPFDDSLPASDFGHDFFNSPTVRLI